MSIIRNFHQGIEVQVKVDGTSINPLGVDNSVKHVGAYLVLLCNLFPKDDDLFFMSAEI